MRYRYLRKIYVFEGAYLSCINILEGVYLSCINTFEDVYLSCIYIFEGVYLSCIYILEGIYLSCIYISEGVYHSCKRTTTLAGTQLVRVKPFIRREEETFQQPTNIWSRGIIWHSFYSFFSLLYLWCETQTTVTAAAAVDTLLGVTSLFPHKLTQVLLSTRLEVKRCLHTNTHVRVKISP